MTHNVPTYLCRRADVPREVAAELDAPPWSEAGGITQFRLIRTAEALATGRFFHAALLWDDEALHVAWRSAPSLIPVTKTTRDDDLWAECTAELFLAAGPGYYEFEVNPLGTVLDLHFPDEADADWLTHRQWDAAGLEWAVRSLGPVVDGSGPWAAQMRIPWLAMPLLSREADSEGEVLQAQVCRSCYGADGQAELPAWGPVKEQFCERPGMGRLVLTC